VTDQLREALEALNRAAVFSAYSAKTPLSIRFDFANDADRIEAANALDEAFATLSSTPTEGDGAGEDELCDDCPPVGYPTDKTRCLPCPRRTPLSPPEVEGLVEELFGLVYANTVIKYQPEAAKRCIRRAFAKLAALRHQPPRTEGEEVVFEARGQAIYRLHHEGQEWLVAQVTIGWDADYLARKLNAALSRPEGMSYQVTAVMQGARRKLVVSGGADPYTTTERAVAERVLAEVRELPLAYADPLIEELRDTAKPAEGMSKALEERCIRNASSYYVELEVGNFIALTQWLREEDAGAPCYCLLANELSALGASRIEMNGHFGANVFFTLNLDNDTSEVREKAVALIDIYVAKALATLSQSPDTENSGE
jgi:hypothetical protein